MILFRKEWKILITISQLTAISDDVGSSLYNKFKDFT